MGLEALLLIGLSSHGFVNLVKCPGQTRNVIECVALWFLDRLVGSCDQTRECTYHATSRFCTQDTRETVLRAKCKCKASCGQKPSTAIFSNVWGSDQPNQSFEVTKQKQKKQKRAIEGSDQNK
eukprot:c11192_g1_i2.p1 GENE.c11192_g1_i2~~c11192_g1_i2.p1  ORF type:complete len:123 (-),score=25.52 c11192_g1_i2:221-589(-)